MRHANFRRIRGIDENGQSLAQQINTSDSRKSILIATECSDVHQSEQLANHVLQPVSSGGQMVIVLQTSDATCIIAAGGKT